MVREFRPLRERTCKTSRRRYPLVDGWMLQVLGTRDKDGSGGRHDDRLDSPTRRINDAKSSVGGQFPLSAWMNRRQ